MIRTLATALLMLLVPLAVSAQTASVTINFEGFYMIQAVTHDCPVNAGSGNVEGFVGDTISCKLTALDNQNTEVPATFTITLNGSPSVADAWIVADSLHVTWLSEGIANINIQASESLNIALFRYEQPGQPLIFEDLTLEVGEEAQLCAYLGSVQSPSRKSAGAVPCPDVGGTPLPTMVVEWTIDDESILQFVDQPHPLTVIALNES